MQGKSVLVTGGSGYIGRALTKLLQAEGYRVSHLSRRNEGMEGVQSFTWDVKQGRIDKASLEGVDAIIHLAGAGIADKRWSTARKEEIMVSRVHSARLIYDNLPEGHQVKAFVSASGTGFYGNSGDTPVNEETGAGDNFLARTCVVWEQAAAIYEQKGIRHVCMRTGFVVSQDSKALEKIAMPARMFAGAPLGSGRQYFPWIHLDDLCAMYLEALRNVTISGPVNAVAPQEITNSGFTQALCRALHRPMWLPAVPGFVVKLMLGEMASVVLDGSRVRPDKMTHLGFRFIYPDAETALREIYGKNG